MKENTENLKFLIESVKKGDKNAFNILYKTYFTPLFRYIYLRINSKTETEDLVQEVFLRVLKNINKFEDRNKSPLNYFFTIARNLIIDYWKKKKEISINNEEILKAIHNNFNPHQIIQEKEINEIIKKSIKNLPTDQQEVIILKFINDMTNKEIANLMDRSEEAVRQLQCRALKKLRQTLKELKIL